jgi:hypothetical protein
MTASKGLMLWIALVSGVGLLRATAMPALAYNGEKPPVGSEDASCRKDNGTPFFCKINVLNRTPAKIQLWLPEGRESARIIEFNGQCLVPGCVLTGDDLGYAAGPEQIEIIEATDAVIIWRSRAGNRGISVIRLLRP